MNPIVESLTGLKAFNDQYITADLLQDCSIRIQLLTHCLSTTVNPELRELFEQQMQVSIKQQQRLLDYSHLKDWLSDNSEQQWVYDLKQAYKASRMI
ncbi:spore coat protein [Paenibacillus pini]|uniref:Uncharacterized protein n=1 Tax=Paenibacillus pini JCM 16418 TaxID=1236976 RepID=W7YJN6_9BACL|nr:spore coat protein [Paenibacillus pini]GAF07893.1 hypothetical protein JCM16418_1926 [Paenibacillus pini JCM 16418]